MGVILCWMGLQALHIIWNTIQVKRIILRLEISESDLGAGANVVQHAWIVLVNLNYKLFFYYYTILLLLVYLKKKNISLDTVKRNKLKNVMLPKGSNNE